MPNAETETTLNNYYAALKSGDAARMRDVVSDDIEVVYQDAEGLLPWGGTWSGFEGFRTFLATVGEHLVIEEVEVQATHLDGDTAVTVLRGVWTAKAASARIEARVVNVFTMRDGRVARYQVFPDTAAFARGLGRIAAPAG